LDKVFVKENDAGVAVLLFCWRATTTVVVVVVVEVVTVVVHACHHPHRRES
jgi:hypothetical protein